MGEITIRKVTRDCSLFLYFVGLKDFCKIMVMVMEVMLVVVMEVMLVVVMVVMIVWNTKICGSFEAGTWQQKALISCRAVIS
jgi:hypothetical protein